MFIYHSSVEGEQRYLHWSGDYTYLCIRYIYIYICHMLLPLWKLSMQHNKWTYRQFENVILYVYRPTCGGGGPGNVVGIAAGYGLGAPGIKSRWRRDFPHLSRPALGPTQPPIQWVPALSRGYRAAGAWRWPLTPFQCGGHERVELYLYSPYGPYGLYRASVPVPGWPLPYLTCGGV